MAKSHISVISYNSGKYRKSKTSLIRSFSKLTVFLLFFGMFNFATAEIFLADTTLPENIVSDELIVKYRDPQNPGTYAAQSLNILSKEDIFGDFVFNDYNDPARQLRASSLVTEVNRPNGYFKVKLSGPDKLKETYKSLKADPDVESVSFNYINKANTYITNDPQSTEQWGFAKVNADAANQQVGGGSDNIVIAVVDNGIRGSHEDLIDKVLDGYDVVTKQAITSGTNVGGAHGTPVSGAAAASCNNSKGIAGIACNAKILPVQVFDGDGAYSENTAKGIVYAVEHGADIINLSLGGDTGVFALDTLLEDALRYAYQSGVVVVAAAGNGVDQNDPAPNPPYLGDDVNATSPANSPYVITVSATQQNDTITTFSNFGQKIDVAAPGLDVTLPDSSGNSSYTATSGTSFSAPITSGVIALMLSKNPNLKVEEVRQILRKTATDVAPTGFDINTGYGVVNADAAVTASVAPTVLEAGIHSLGDNTYKGTVGVLGTAKGNGLSSYKLEYGTSYNPGSWAEIMTSTSQVNNSLLGNWNTSTLSTGVYTLRLTATKSDSSVYTNTVYLKIDSVKPMLLVNNPVVTGSTTSSISGSAKASSGNISALSYCVGSVYNTCTLTPISFTPGTTVNYSFNMLGLVEGQNQFRVKATDSAGSVYYYGVLEVDTVDPAVPVISSPANNSASYVADITLGGTGPRDASIHIYRGSTELAVVETNYNGDWAKQVTLIAGQNNLTAKSIDVAGNQSPAVNLVVNYEVDTNKVLIPTFSPAAGAVSSGTTVTISSATAGSTIYYTTDGTMPTTSSTQGSTVNIDSAKTVKALATKDTMTNSDIGSAVYTIATVATPTFSPVGGVVDSGTTITISSATSGATIYYTTDGSTPTTSSAQGSSVIISGAMTLKALAVKTNMTNSSIGSATYTIAATAAPIFSPTSGAVISPTTVTISSTTSGATIYYTTDGTTPTTSSTQGVSVTVNSAMTIKALATKVNKTNSTVTSATYTIAVQDTCPSCEIKNSNNPVVKNGVTVNFPQLPSNLGDGFNIAVTQKDAGTREKAADKNTLVIYDITPSKSLSGSYSATVTLTYPNGASFKTGDTVSYWDGSKWSNSGITNITGSGNNISFTTNHFSEFGILTSSASGDSGTGGTTGTTGAVGTTAVVGILPTTGSTVLIVFLNFFLALGGYVLLHRSLKKSRFAAFVN